MSAKHGLVDRATVISPYEQTLLTVDAMERRAWSDRVGRQLLEVLPSHAVVLFLAGQRYREHLERFLTERGFRVEVPLRGLGIGKQLQWLKRANG